MNHSTVSRKGGQARSEAKTLANRAKAKAFWRAVRAGKAAGKAQAPARPRTPPDAESVARLLATYCRANGIRRLEVFGSVSRGTARRGSDVDLVVTFETPPGLRFFGMEQEMAAILQAPVHLILREDLDEMTNPFRKQSIIADVREIYSA